ncbi:hypothetical protein GGQ87_002488 [Brevundimonas alba]|uniref:Uncharacterized protein n=1 Tax=Brevundimonas alba TaxID=74314 RepID=A0A7X5YLZ8_9CAUL|nr:hypothetical protein [Brevundimonas alba]NJC42193.1 hypothetical protein [Brevundimonas alba]
MPLPRNPRPPRPPPPSFEALLRAEMHRRETVWRDAVHAESWRLVYADGLRCAGPAEWARGRRSLIDQGILPPPWLPEAEGL